MAVCLIILIIIIVLWVRFKDCKKEIFQTLPSKGNELKFFYSMAYGLLAELKKYRISLSNLRRRKLIECLNIVREIKDTEVLYNVRRIAMVIAVIGVTAIMGLLYNLAHDDAGMITNNMITRPAYGKDKLVIDFLANDNEITVEINPLEYTIEEVRENFVNAYEYLLEEIKGENISLSQINKKLNLINYIEKYAMDVSWMSSKPELIDLYGNVNNYEFTEGIEEEVVLTANLSYLDYECQYEIYVNVTAPILTEKEKFIRNLKSLIKQSEEADRTKEFVSLPETVNEKAVEYKEDENYTVFLVLLGIITACVIFPAMDKDLEGKIKERNQQMMLDYSEIVSKLNILSGAGMSILKAWEKIVKDYEKKIEKNPVNKRYAYEEMKITYYEIQSGISESNAYSNFGKRCNIHEYLKLGALLEQNIRKGAKGLSKMLEEESIQAFEQRKNLAKKLGEEAGTKMLVPMIIMLAIVMVIVLIPAFTSFNV